LLTDRASIFLY